MRALSVCITSTHHHNYILTLIAIQIPLGWIPLHPPWNPQSDLVRNRLLNQHQKKSLMKIRETMKRLSRPIPRRPGVPHQTQPDSGHPSRVMNLPRDLVQSQPRYQHQSRRRKLQALPVSRQIIPDHNQHLLLPYILLIIPPWRMTSTRTATRFNSSDSAIGRNAADVKEIAMKIPSAAMASYVCNEREMIREFSGAVELPSGMSTIASERRIWMRR